VQLCLLACQIVIEHAQAADNAVTRTFDSNGVKISYMVQGQGEPVVLIHGWISSALFNWSFPGTSAALAKNYRVIAMDVRGHGFSDKPTTDEAYGRELVEDVLRLLDHLKIEKAHIAGYSMGGIIAMNFIVKHPDRVLTGTLGGMGWLKVGGLGQKGFEQIGKNDPNAKALTICGRSLAKLALTEEEIKTVRVPITVLVGDDDGLIKGLYVDPLKSVRKDWQVIEIKNANHISCVVKPQFQQELAASLKKSAK
jgi:pimeloyl-ACP methyl ester carboxylesterase